MLGDGTEAMVAILDLALALQAQLVTDLARIDLLAQGSAQALRASQYLLVVISKRHSVL